MDWVVSWLVQVSITLIATGFQAQEFEARNLQAKLSAHLNSLFCSQSVFDASSLLLHLSIVLKWTTNTNFIITVEY
jgi:hypothetical protein